MSDIKNKFLSDLRTELKNSKIDNYEDILKSYISQYDDRISKGLTDMEVVIALGDPSDIVQALTMSDKDSRKALENRLSQSVADLIGNKSEESPKGDKSKEEKTKKRGQYKSIQSKDSIIDNGNSVIEQTISNEQDVALPNLPLQKKSIFARIILFIIMALLAIASPLSLIYAGLKYLDKATFTTEVIISLTIGGVGLMLFLMIRKVTKNHIINGN